MTKANDLASLLDANGDVVSSALDNVPSSDLVNDTTPQLGGTLDTNTNDINFGTNVKSNYGTSAQLMMYHDGSNGWIKGNNAGNNSIAIQSGGTGSVMISGSSGQNIISQQGDAAYLHHAGFAKLITTASGCDVTGGVTATGIIESSYGTNGWLQFGLGTALTNGAGTYDSSVRWNGSSGNLLFSQGAVEKMRITSTSVDVTGGLTTTGNVGIKNPNPSTPLDVTTAGGANWVAQFQNNSAGNSYGVSISEPSGATAGYPLLRVGQGFSPYGDYLRVNTNGNSGFGGSPSTLARVNIQTTSDDKAGLRVKRSFYNWFQWGGNPSTSYLHIKTGLASGSVSNTNPTMSLFHIKGYNYNAETIDTLIGFHNWSGSPYQLVITNNGTRAAGLSPYSSSDGYVVLVVDTGTNYPGITIDWHQAYAYNFVDVGVLNYTSSSSTSGVY